MPQMSWLLPPSLLSWVHISFLLKSKEIPVCIIIAWLYVRLCFGLHWQHLWSTSSNLDDALKQSHLHAARKCKWLPDTHRYFNLIFTENKWARLTVRESLLCVRLCTILLSHSVLSVLPAPHWLKMKTRETGTRYCFCSTCSAAGPSLAEFCIFFNGKG